MALQKRDKTNPHPPVHARPGSREKLSILAERAQRGETLFQDHDFAWPESALVAWLRQPSEFRAALLRTL
jgi:hypothetical protein